MFNMQRGVKNESAVCSKNAVVNILLVTNALSWYLWFFSFLKNNLNFVDDVFVMFSGGNLFSISAANVLVLIVGVNLLSVSLAAFLSTKFQKIENRLRFIVYWMAIGVLLSPAILFVGSGSFCCVVLISCIMGVYFGFGFPVLMGYYTANTVGVNRAKISGLAVFFTFLCFALLSLLFHNVVLVALVLVLWKLCGLIAILLLKPSEKTTVTEEPVSYRTVLKTRSVLLYFVPWLIFSIVNNFAFPVLYTVFDKSFIDFFTMLEGVLVGIFAILFGFLADYMGRKRLLFFGFTMLGLGYAILGLFPSYTRGLLFYTVADSIAWGIFMTLFLLTVWGDLADEKSGEKFFVIGFLPYLFSNFLQVLFGHYIATVVTDLTAVFAFAGFFLFITVVPLYMAHEPLSEKLLKDNDLKRYSFQIQERANKEKNGGGKNFLARLKDKFLKFVGRSKV